MNQANYCTLEAAKRLVEAGIVLETDFCWINAGTDIGYLLRPTHQCEFLSRIPAPCFTEVWRELPDSIDSRKFIYELVMMKDANDLTKISYSLMANNVDIHAIENTNPTDALIDLLIWVKEQK